MKIEILPGVVNTPNCPRLKWVIIAGIALTLWFMVLGCVTCAILI